MTDDKRLTFRERLYLIARPPTALSEETTRYQGRREGWIEAIEYLASQEDFLMGPSVGELEEALLDVLWQTCADPVLGKGMGEPEVMDSMARRSYAAALRLLARRGRVRIIKDVGRRVVAVPISPRTDETILE